MEPKVNYDITDVTMEFNKSLKQILNILDQTVKNSIILDTIRRKVYNSIEIHPLYLLDEGGPYIFEYRDYIINDEFDKLFLDTENIISDKYKKEIDKHSKSIDDNEKNNILSLLLILRDTWKNYSIKEKKQVKKHISNLLSAYCKRLKVVMNH